MTSLISHTWTYVPLIHDVLNMKLNRITVEVYFINKFLLQ